MAKASKISATLRTDFGKGFARRARVAGQVPAVVYGHGTDPKHVLVDGHESYMVLRGTSNALVELNVEGEKILTIVKDIQRHPLRPGFQHIDFMIVNRSEKVSVEVPVVVVGEAAPATMHTIELAHLSVSVPVVDIPESIEVDVTGLEAGTIITVADLKVADDVEIHNEAELPVVNIAANEEEEAPEEEAPAEAATEEAAE